MFVAVEAPVRGPGVGGRQPRGEVHRRGLGAEPGGGGPRPGHYLRVPRPGAGEGAVVSNQELELSTTLAKFSLLGPSPC